MEEPRAELEADAEEAVVLNRAVWRKWNRFTWSGLLLIGLGCIMIVLGLLLNTGAYSAEGLLLGFGAIVVLIGIVRIFIGIINPSTPSDLRRGRHRSEDDDILTAAYEEERPSQ